MSFWISAFCTKSLGALTMADLRHATADGDFSVMAESQGLDDEVGEAVERMLRFEVEGEEPPGDFTRARMYYLPDDPGFVVVFRSREDEARGIALEHKDAPEAVGPAQSELMQRLGAARARSARARRVHDVLSRTVEVISFCLRLSDVNGMGWPVSWHTAMWLAHKGEGLVDAEGLWWDPKTYKRI